MSMEPRSLRTFLVARPRLLILLFRVPWFQSIAAREWREDHDCIVMERNDRLLCRSSRLMQETRLIQEGLGPRWTALRRSLDSAAEVVALCLVFCIRIAPFSTGVNVEAQVGL